MVVWYIVTQLLTRNFMVLNVIYEFFFLKQYNNSTIWDVFTCFARHAQSFFWFFGADLFSDLKSQCILMKHQMQKSIVWDILLSMPWKHLNRNSDVNPNSLYFVFIPRYGCFEAMMVSLKKLFLVHQDFLEIRFYFLLICSVMLRSSMSSDISCLWYYTQKQFNQILQIESPQPSAYSKW